jgi:hypothetical protein
MFGVSLVYVRLKVLNSMLGARRPQIIGESAEFGVHVIVVTDLRGIK